MVCSTARLLAWQLAVIIFDSGLYLCVMVVLGSGLCAGLSVCFCGAVRAPACYPLTLKCHALQQPLK